MHRMKMRSQGTEIEVSHSIHMLIKLGNRIIRRKMANQLEFWQNRWETGKAGWHKQDINQHLKKYYEKCEKGKIWWFLIHLNILVLVPLCGKTKDLLWLTEQGCDVVGVEFCPQAVAEFFNEHQIPHEKTDSAYVATDRKLKVYYGDFFTCPIVEKVSFALLSLCI